MIQINTDRLILKVLGKSAASAVLDYSLRNKAFFQPWVPSYPDHYFDMDYIEKNLERDWFSAASGQMLRFYILHQTDEKQQYILGDITYSQIQRGSTQSCYLGYKVDERMAGQGIITEAIRAANEYLFVKARLHRIEACIMPRNLSSLRVAEKLGFQNEGLARKFLKINGVWEDHYRFALLNEENEEEIGA